MTNTRKLAWIAILSAISFLLMFASFPLLGVAPFLRVELSIIPVLIGLVLFDLKSALGILLLRSLLKLLLNNTGANTLIGLPMNIVALAVFTISFALIWNKHKGQIQFVLAAIAGTFSLTLVMLILNYVYAVPLYAKFAGTDIAKIYGIANYLFTIIIPFNLIQGAILAIVFWFAYYLLKRILKQYER